MNDIINTINECDSILLLTHENPDGDAIGSVLAMYHLLKDWNKNVDVLIPKMPETFMFMNSVDMILNESDKKYDLAIVLDCASKERIGQNNKEFDNCNKSIVIDHHAINTKYGSINNIEGNVASCCQVLYYLFDKWNIEITPKIGEALTVGMLTDTAGFRNCNVDEKTFMMAARLSNIVDMHKLYYLVLSKKTIAEYLLIKMTLDRLEFYEDGKIAFSYISHEDMENVNAKYGDHEGLVDLGRNVEGVEVSIFMREDDGYTISFRSNGKIDVNKLAKKFGGGGHRMAAGAKSELPFKETKEMLINETIKEFYK